MPRRMAAVRPPLAAGKTIFLRRSLSVSPNASPPSRIDCGTARRASSATLVMVGINSTAMISDVVNKARPESIPTALAKVF